MDKDFNAALLKRLDVCISLLLRLVEQDGVPLSVREQVRILNMLGLRPVEIAAILGKTQTYINKELVGIRRGRR